MAFTAKGLALAAKITALTTGTGPTAPQKAQLQLVVEALDAAIRDGQLDADFTKVYNALNGLS